MELGKRSGSQMKPGHEELGLGLGLGPFPVSWSSRRKRVLVSSHVEVSPPRSVHRAPLKRRCSGGMAREDAGNSVLESMPQEILIKILCGVDHDDLKRLFHVSSTIRDATLVARKSHFAYSTPTKVRAFRNPLINGEEEEESSGFEEFQTPDAPKQSRKGRPRLRERPSFAVTLFLDED